MRSHLILAALFGLGITASTFAQNTGTPPKKDAAPAAPKKVEPPAPKKDDKPADKGMGKDDQPGANHELLKALEGEWTVEMKEFAPDGTSTSSDKGTMTNKMVFGGRFLSMEYDGRYHGKFFRGAGLLGYNNADKRFEQSWADSASTAMTFMTGAADSAGKVITVSSELTDPSTGKKGKQRQVTTITGKDSYKQEFYFDLGGKEFKVMEGTYSRGKLTDNAKPDKKPDAKDDKKDDKPGKGK